jgi:hypothetical protein
MPNQTGQKFLINLSRRFNQPAEGRVVPKRRQRPGPPRDHEPLFGESDAVHG